MDCYCIMVKTGSEEKFKNAATEKLALQGDNSKLYFFKKKMRARKGPDFEEPLFPGYIFMETENLERSSVEALKKVSGFYHFLFDNAEPQKLQGNDLEYFSVFRKSGEPSLFQMDIAGWIGAEENVEISDLRNGGVEKC